LRSQTFRGVRKIFERIATNSLQKCQPVIVAILQTNAHDQHPSIDEACREFEQRCDISPEFFVHASKTPKMNQLIYENPIDKLEKALIDPARIRINKKFFRLFTKCPQTFKLNIFGFSRNALKDENNIRKVCEGFGSNL
jgi:hypothetical protein